MPWKMGNLNLKMTIILEITSKSLDIRLTPAIHLQTSKPWLGGIYSKSWFFGKNRPKWAKNNPKMTDFYWFSMFSQSKIQSNVFKMFSQDPKTSKKPLILAVLSTFGTIRTRFCILLNPYNIYIIWSFTQLLPVLFYIPNLFRIFCTHFGVTVSTYWVQAIPKHLRFCFTQSLEFDSSIVLLFLNL